MDIESIARDLLAARPAPTTRTLLGGAAGVLTLWEAAVIAVALDLAGFELPTRSFAAKYWALMGQARLDLALGRRTWVEKPEDLIDPLRPVIFVSPHPRTEATFSSGAAWVDCDFEAVVAPLVKAELLRGMNPIGIVGKAVGAIFIHRDKPHEALTRVREEVARLLDDAQQLAAVIYPDGSRGSEQKRAAALRKLISRYAEDAEMCQQLERICAQTMPPRAAGLFTLLQAMPQAQVVFATIASKHKGQRPLQVLGKTPGDVLVRLRPMPEVRGCQNITQLQRMLNLVWLEEVLPLQGEVDALDFPGWAAEDPVRRQRMPRVFGRSVQLAWLALLRALEDFGPYAR